MPETNSIISEIKHLDQFIGPWAIQEQAMEALRTKVEMLDLRAHLASPEARAAFARAENPAPLQVTSDGIAVINIEGSLQKHESSMGGTSTVAIRKQIREAARSSEVKGIMLRIESPGGTVAGIAEFADEITKAKASKPVHAFIEDIGASGAYWPAAQADKISVNRTGQVGSIGTFMVVRDYSQQAESNGVKVHVVRAGAFKGAGTPGTEVTDEQLATLQQHVNNLNEHFIQAVATGRGMSIESVRQLADGRVHIGEQAKQLGLVDAVSTFDEAMSSLLSSIPKRSSAVMSESKERVAATLQELKAGCPGASSDFILSHIERGSTLAEAQSALLQDQAKANAELQEQLKAEREKAAKAEADAAKVKEAAEGVEPIKAGSSAEAYSGNDPRAEWNEAIQSKVKQGMSRQRAVAAVNRENPGLRAAMLAAVN